MKRFFTLILLFAYLFTSSGASINLHYCMGKLADWSYWDKADRRKCGKCGMEKKTNSCKGCCKDEHKWVKIQDDQKANYISIYLAQLQPAEAVSFPNNFTDQFFNSTVALLAQSNAPPRRCVIAIYKRNCVFRI